MFDDCVFLVQDKLSSEPCREVGEGIPCSKEAILKSPAIANSRSIFNVSGKRGRDGRLSRVVEEAQSAKAYSVPISKEER